MAYNSNMYSWNSIQKSSIRHIFGLNSDILKLRIQPQYQDADQYYCILGKVILLTYMEEKPGKSQ